MIEINSEELRKIQRKERKLQLSQIPEDFYQLAGNFLKKLEEEKKWNERENDYLILKDIYERRMEKIIKAAFNYSMVEKPQNMIKSEEKFYYSLLELIKNNEREFFETITQGSKKIEEGIEMKDLSKVEELERREEVGKESEEKVKIYIEKNIDKFVGMDGKVYGPYREGDIIEVSQDEAKIFMKLKIAKEIG
ncbi:MAG: hypothetical protein QXI58_03680 [Candidatus Micrarchaeia archaeon]